MKLMIGKQEISKVMQISQSIVEKKSTMPILQNALLVAEGDLLTVSSSDMEISVISKVKAHVMEEGSTTIGAKFFSEAIKKLPDEDVILELEESEILKISSASGDATMRLNCISASSYPSFPTSEIDAKHEVKASDLLAMIDKTFFAVSNDETRWSLNGICLKKAENGTVDAVATDGHRLAICTRKIKSKFLEDTIIIPKKGIPELKKILEEEGDNNILVEVTESLIVIETKSEKIGMRLIDANYPDYTKGLPEGESKKIEIDTDKIAKALDMMTYMNSDKDKKMRMHFENNELIITSTNPGMGEAKSIVKDIAYNDEEPMELGFNPKYLLDIVTNLADEKVVFELYQTLKPIKIYSPKDESCVAYLMPMRIKTN